MASLQEIMLSLNETNKRQLESSYNLEIMTMTLEDSQTDLLEVNLEIMSAIMKMSDSLSSILVSIGKSFDNSLESGFMLLVDAQKKSEREKTRREKLKDLQGEEEKKEEKEKKKPVGAFKQGFQQGKEEGPFAFVGEMIKNAKLVIAGFIGSIGFFFGKVVSLVTGIGKLLKGAVKLITKFSKVAFNVMKRMFIPLTLLISAFNMVTGFIEEFKNEEGSFIDKMLAGVLGGITKTIKNLVMLLLDMLKSAASWVLDKLGFEELAETLNSFSFVDWYESAAATVKDMLFGLKDWLTETLSWENIKTSISDLGSKILDSIIETIKEFVRQIINGIPNMLQWVIPDKVQQFAGINAETGELTEEQQKKEKSKEVNLKKKELDLKEKELTNMLVGGMFTSALDINDPRITEKTREVTAARAALSSAQTNSSIVNNELSSSQPSVLEGVSTRVLQSNVLNENTRQNTETREINSKAPVVLAPSSTNNTTNNSSNVSNIIASAMPQTKDRNDPYTGVLRR